MFAEIRKRLVLFNTGLTGLLLICLMFVSYFGLKAVFYHQEEQEMVSYAKEEAAEAAEDIPLLKNDPIKGSDQEDFESNDRMYCYIFDLHHRLLTAEIPDQKRNRVIFPIIRNWKFPAGRAKHITVQISQKNRIFIIIAYNISDHEQLLGRIYVAKDATTYYDRLNVYLLVLWLIGLFFLFGVYRIGNIMADKAMVPIYKSFEQQRQFTADASHELRTPLTVLLSGTEAIIADKENEKSVFVSQTLLDMKDEIQKLNKIVANLLMLARADEEGQKILKENCDIVAIVQQVAHSLSPLAVNKNIHIGLNLPDQLGAFADRERLYQLIYILLDNAIKYTPREGKVLIKVSKKEDNVRISVHDTGIGIAPEYQKRIFERFYRVDKSRSREQGGTGLGLSIAKWIVSAHDGIIEVKSALGQGTTFEVRLKLK